MFWLPPVFLNKLEQNDEVLDEEQSRAIHTPVRIRADPWARTINHRMVK